MITLDTIRRPVARELEEFETFVREKFSAEGALLSEMLDYALSSRGKAVRPTLVLLAAALHASSGSRAVGLRSYVAAMLVEMIHVASLIHDDVIDEADTRRGRPSPNARWQSRNAVILGDYILARNMSLGMSSGQFDIVSHVCEAIATLCEGEIYQSDCARRQLVSRDAYYEVIRKKTASLLGVSASAGALSVGASREQVQRMRRFGEMLGMAFQIQDDILDFRRMAHTGKSANNDLREGKITLPLLVVLEVCSEGRQRELLADLSACATDEGAVDRLQRVVETEEGVERAAKIMRGMLAEALALLGATDETTHEPLYADSPVKKALADLCVYVAERDC